MSADATDAGAVPQDARARWADLVDRINRARAEYYQEDRPTLSDADYDVLFAELAALEQQWPQLVGGESPTQTVGGQRAEMFDPVEHLQRMYSLDNAFDVDELQAWFDRVERGLDALPEMLCELKIDGLAVDAVYADGRLRSLATRGDGRVGEDVTYNAAYIPAVPQRLQSASGRPVPRLLEVRGEIFFPVADFERINSEQLDLGLPAFANPRNTAAGSLRQRIDRREAELAGVRSEGRSGDRAEARLARLEAELARAVVRLTGLKLTVHGIGAVDGVAISRQSEGYEVLADLGLQEVVGGEHLEQVRHGLDEVAAEQFLRAQHPERGFRDQQRERADPPDGDRRSGEPPHYSSLRRRSRISWSSRAISSASLRMRASWRESS